MSGHPPIERAPISPVPVAALIGFSIEPLGDGQAVGRLETGPQHANPMGTLHGGILCDVADAAMGMAFVTTLKPDESFTATLTVTFFRPVQSSNVVIWPGSAWRPPLRRPCTIACRQTSWHFSHS